MFSTICMSCLTHVSIKIMLTKYQAAKKKKKKIVIISFMRPCAPRLKKNVVCCVYGRNSSLSTCIQNLLYTYNYLCKEVHDTAYMMEDEGCTTFLLSYIAHKCENVSLSLVFKKYPFSRPIKKERTT